VAVAGDQVADLDRVTGGQQFPVEQQRPGWRRGRGAQPDLELDREQVAAGGDQDALFAGDQRLLAGLPPGDIGGVGVADADLVVEGEDLEAVKRSMQFIEGVRDAPSVLTLTGTRPHEQGADACQEVWSPCHTARVRRCPSRCWSG
jgi:hypothetical protein